MQPEEVFSALHNFSMTLEKGHRYNLDCDEKAQKQARMDAAAAKHAQDRAAKKTTGKAVQGRANLVDGAQAGMRNGIRARPQAKAK